ncbi:MAG: class I SAM-dependent methyltransferase [Alphaproteobacteria bacterium]|nr:class I SAM-dependent methyltransferase [Alphaproteobacteria bacterium]
MDPVRTQYESYPYPSRDPEDERRRLVTGSPSRLAEIDHYLFRGERDWTAPFRALIAGGGTGDALIMLATELSARAAPAEIVYLDLSRASREIAEARARVRGLGNIRFETGSLLDAEGLGPFDYIDCCGVLHHLENPAAGLAALTRALSEEGGLGLMVYGTLGRTGVYDVQEALKILAPPGEAPKERLATARSLLSALPPTSRFKRNPFVGDHLSSDAGLYDLLLHERDRAYGVDEIGALLAQSGLALASFVPPALYEPETFLQPAELRARCAGLDTLARARLAELLGGSLKTHVFYAAPKARGATVATPSPSAIPLLLDMDPAALARTCAQGRPLAGTLDGLRLSFPLPRGCAEAIALVDGRRSFGDIAAATGLEWEAFQERFAPAYRALNGLNILLMTRSQVV